MPDSLKSCLTVVAVCGILVILMNVFPDVVQAPGWLPFVVVFLVVVAVIYTVKCFLGLGSGSGGSRRSGGCPGCGNMHDFRVDSEKTTCNQCGYSVRFDLYD